MTSELLSRLYSNSVWKRTVKSLSFPLSNLAPASMIDDDKLQDIYFQMSQINPSPVYQVGGTGIIDAVKEGAAKLDDQGYKPIS